MVVMFCPAMWGPPFVATSGNTLGRVLQGLARIAADGYPARRMSTATESRRSAIAVALCLAALVVAALLLHREALFGGQVYHMDDAADGYYPSHVAILRAWAEGKLPTWERGAWSGWPLVVDPYYGPFYPGTLLFAIAGAARGLAWVVAMHVVLGAVGMLLLCRRRGLPWAAALLAAASLGFSSFMVVRIRHVIFIEALAWLPWLFVAIEGWVQRRRLGDLALGASAIGLGLLSGGLPLLPFFALVVAAYALPRLARVGVDGESARRARLVALGGLAAAGVVGLLVGAAQLLPTLSHMPLSPRMLGTDPSFASSYAWPSPAYLGTLLAPDLFGGEERAAWFGAFNHWEMAGYYAGAWVVALAPVGLARARRRPELWALFAVSVVAVLLAFGDKGPLHGLFFRHLPLYAALRCPTRALVMALAVWPLLAAEGLTWLLKLLDENDPPAIARRALLLRAGAVVIAVGAALALARVVTHPRPPTPPAQLAARAALAHLGVVAVAGLAILVALGRARPRLAATAIALLTLVDLVVVGRGSIQPKPGDWPAGTDRFHAVAWLEEHARGPEAGRFIPDAGGPFRLHNVGMVYGLESAGGYDSVSVWRMVHLLWLNDHGAPYPHDKLKDDLAAGVLRRLDGPLVDLLNVRWAIASRAPGPRWIERFRPRPGEPPLARHERTWDGQLGVYENPQALPRAFVVYQATVVPPVEGETARGRDVALARALLAIDPRTTVLLEEAPDPAPSGRPLPLTPARVVEAARDRVVVEAEAAEPGVLVLSETAYPGWRATVDGVERPLLTADYALRGVALAPGRHRVEFTFRHRPTERGLALAGVGLAGLVALVAASLVARRRRRRMAGARR
jgi:hypothetical protein